MKAAHEGVKLMKSLKREKLLRHRNSFLATMVKIMRENGASDRTTAAIPMDNFALAALPL